jgi:hypothetical protein
LLAVREAGKSDNPEIKLRAKGLHNDAELSYFQESPFFCLIVNDVDHRIRGERPAFYKIGPILRDHPAHTYGPGKRSDGRICVFCIMEAKGLTPAKLKQVQSFGYDVELIPTWWGTGNAKISYEPGWKKGLVLIDSTLKEYGHPCPQKSSVPAKAR